MAGNWNHWMKQIAKELMTPPSFLHHPSQTQTQNKHTETQNRNSSVSKKKKIDSEDRPVSTSRSFPTQISSNSAGNYQNGKEQEAILQSVAIPAEVIERFGIKPYKLEPFGSILRARTHNGMFAIKKTTVPQARIVFMDEALQYATQNDFTKFAPFVHSRIGKPYLTFGGITYYCSKWVLGSECDFTSMPQLTEAAFTLASFYQATEGFESERFTPVSAFDLVEQFRARQVDLRKFARKARSTKHPSEVDRWVRSHLSHYREQAKESLAIMELPECKEQIIQDQKNAGLCHLDVTPHNLIYTSKHHISLLDFDLMTHGPRVLDFAHLLRRSLQTNHWTRECAVAQLIAINGVKHLTHEEYLLIQALLLFPLRVWRVLSSYYAGEAKEGTLEWLEQIEAQEEARQNFLQLYASQVTHYI